jgi:chaperonin cofactor prefoldin
LDSNLTAAIISASGSTLVAIVALLVNSQRFGDMNQRFSDMSKRLDSMERRMERLESKLDHIEQLLVGYALDVARIKEKLQIP